MNYKFQATSYNPNKRIQLTAHRIPLFCFSAFLLFACCFLPFGALAQIEKEKELQQLEQEIASGKLTDNEMFINYESLMYEYSNIEREKTFFWFNKAIDFARKKKNIEFEADFLTRMADNYNTWDENDTAFIYLDKALKLIEGKNLYLTESIIYKTKAGIYSDLYISDKAMDNYLKALEINEKDKVAKNHTKQDIAMNLRNEVSILNNIAVIYFNQYNFDMSLDYFLKAKKIMDENPTVRFGYFEGAIISNIASHYLRRGDYEKAFPLIEQGYQLAVKNNNTHGIITGLFDYARFYELKGDHKTQLRYAKEAIQMAEETFHSFVYKAEIIVMGAYYQLKDYKTALYYGENLLLSVPENDWFQLKNLYAYLMMIYAYKNDIKNAEKYLEKYKDIVEKMSDKNMQDAVQEMNVKYEVQQKEQELARRQTEIKRQKNIRYISLAIALLIIGFAAYIIMLRTKRNRELTEMNATKDKFFKIISHDLKNPAITQRNALQLLLENNNQWDTDSLTKYYKALLKSADSQIDMLYNMLNWAQVQTGKMAYNPVAFDIAAAMKPDLHLIKNMAASKGITFETLIPEEVLITGSENMLTTVLRNLLTNAVKFTGDGGTVRLEIGANERTSERVNGRTGEISPAGGGRGVDKPDGYVISVVDTGIGMSAEQLQNLFKIDRRSLQKGTSGETGTGLGLMVCKELLAKHGTTLHIESEEGKGCRVWFEI
jgi:signal transduction histidine kinase